MFAILAINLLKERFGYCDIPGGDYYSINKDDCAELGFKWDTFSTNFDNIYKAMVTLFIISSLEGWPSIMFITIDSNESTYGPEKDSLKIIAFYFIGFILVGSFFLLNLFVGVIFFHF